MMSFKQIPGVIYNILPTYKSEALQWAQECFDALSKTLLKKRFVDMPFFYTVRDWFVNTLYLKDHDKIYKKGCGTSMCDAILNFIIIREGEV
jgi:hypothetical protein